MGKSVAKKGGSEKMVKKSNFQVSMKRSGKRKSPINYSSVEVAQRRLEIVSDFVAAGLSRKNSEESADRWVEALEEARDEFNEW